MKRLWYWPIDPLARTGRLVLGEKGWTTEGIVITPWVSDLELSALAPGASQPALLDTDAETRVSCVGTIAICEYIEETQQSPRLLPFPAPALKNRMTFLDALAGERAYLAGRTLSMADLSVAAHLSSYDYFGDVLWEAVPDLKAWYGRMKSRPSFRTLLEDRVGSSKPAKHYTDLDF